MIRDTRSEQIDNLSLNGKQLHLTLKSLAWINQYFGNRQNIIQPVLNVIRENPQIKHFHIVDLACGGGDMLLILAGTLASRGISFSMTGIDGNEYSLKYAQEKSGAYPTIHYLQADILNPEFRIPACDILISSHFIYHYSATALINFFESNMPLVRLVFINSGLERNVWASRLFHWFGFLLPINAIAKKDGLIAIRRAFTKIELLTILEQTSYKYTVNRVALFRLILQVAAR